MESRIYSSPKIERIDLDTEISLALQSVDEPPFGPYESKLQTPMYFNDSVLKTELT